MWLSSMDKVYARNGTYGADAINLSMIPGT